MHFLTPNTTYRHEHHGSCPLALAAGACGAHLCMGSHVYACSACCHRGLSIMERIFLSCHQSNVPNPPLMQTQIKRSSLNETQMWNVSAELHLRQRPLRGFLFPESHNTRKTVSITPRASQALQVSLEGKHKHVFSVYLSKLAPIRAQSDQTEE